MTLTRVQNTYLVSQNFEDALSFYLGLGAHLKFRDDSRWAQLDIGGTKLALASVSEASPLLHGTAIVLETGDIEAEVNCVIRLGGKVIARRDMGNHGKTALCADLNGNIFQLIGFSTEPKAP